MRLISYVGFVIFILLIDMIQRTWGGTLIKFAGISCNAVDPSFCRFDKCVLKTKNRDLQELSLVVKLLKIPIDNITVRAEIKRRGHNAQTIYRFEMDGCQFWITKRQNPFAKALYAFFRVDTYTNMNHSCPYDHDLIFDRMPFIGYFNMPLPLPKDEYVLTSYWLAYNVVRGTLSIGMQIVD